MSGVTRKVTKTTVTSYSESYSSSSSSHTVRQDGQVVEHQEQHSSSHSSSGPQVQQVQIRTSSDSFLDAETRRKLTTDLDLGCLEPASKNTNTSSVTMEINTNGVAKDTNKSSVTKETNTSSVTKEIKTSGVTKEIKTSGVTKATDVKQLAEDEMQRLRSEMKLMTLRSEEDSAVRSGSNDPNVVRITREALSEFTDDKDPQRLKFNLDVHEMASESLQVKAIGNKIEVHGKRYRKSGGNASTAGEESEEFSRTYELPGNLEKEKVTSSFYKDGVLTVELPRDAVKSTA
nr:small heat shock protein [Spinther sp. ID1]